MAGANVNLGVSGLAEFKRNIKDARETVRTFDEALKLNEKQADTSSLYIENKISIMKEQIEAQTQVVAEQQKQLEQMLKDGTSPSSASYQKVLGQKYSETAKLEDMKKALKDVEDGANGATSGLSSVDETVNTISRNQAWQNVSDGIGKVTDTLEKGARAAMNFGRKIINSLKSSTGWADDLKTMSDSYDIPMDKLQRMEKVAYIVETDSEAILTARQRMAKAVSGEGREDLAELLGIKITGNEDPEDLFWDVGEALLNMENALDRDATAQKLFGRSWREFVPLFKTGREEYEKMLSEQTVLTDEQIQNLTQADDAIAKMELEIQTLKNEFWSKNAPIITELFDWLIKNKETVVGVIEAIGVAFGGLKLADLATNIGQIVSGFKTLGVIQGGEDAAATGGSIFARAKSAVGLESIAGVGGLATIALAFKWAANQRNNNAAAVRGTDENLAAQSAGAEALLADYIRAQQAMANMDWDAAAEVFEAAQKNVTESYDKLMAAEGGESALKAYSDWRQERSLGNMDWEMPENIARMTQTLEDSFAGQQQSNSEVTAALGNLEGLPAAMSAAVQAGMSNVTIVISESAVGAIGRRTGKMFGNAVQALVK